MPSYCAVFKCGSLGGRDNVSFHTFPAIRNHKHRQDLNKLSAERRETWLRALKRKDLTEAKLKYAKVCGKHFITGAPAELVDKDNPDWCPSQHLGYIGVSCRKRKDLERHIRNVERGKKMKEQERLIAVSSEETAKCSGRDTIEVVDDELGVSCQTEISMDGLSKLFKDLKICNEELSSLQQKLLKSDYSEESFRDNDTKTRYYTGLPTFKVFYILYKTVLPFLSNHHNRALSTFQQLLLTLMKLRLNSDFTDLGYRFHVSKTTASVCFHVCIDILYKRLKKLIVWPDREVSRLSMPSCFKASFKNRVTVIIDCFEVFIERPPNLLTAAQCWSNYKHHSTVKFFIGITPQGTVCYISEAWGGRASDKHIVENSSFLNNILPHDVVLADRGFLIKDTLACLQATLELPVFTKGKNQLHPVEIEQTRAIANVRIHVERVIGSVRQKYRILEGCLPISMVSVIKNDVSVLDQIVLVSCALVNLCPSMVPM